MDYQPYTFELPDPLPDAPEPASEKVRHLPLPDGKHWVKVRGGATQREGAYLAHLDRLIRPKYDTLEEEDAAILLYNRGLATFLADRIVDHNLTYPDSEEKLPLGMALFFEMPGLEAIRLVRFIQSPPSFFVDPKAEKRSAGG